MDSLSSTTTDSETLKLLESQNITVTENGDKAFSTSGTKCLDFFFRITRSAPVSDYVPAFFEAWLENPNIATRILLNLRDCRFGKGEKLIPIVLLACLKRSIHESIYNELIHSVWSVGCGKDLLRILELHRKFSLKLNEETDKKTPIEIKIFADQLEDDYRVYLNGKDETQKVKISLCAKWAPSEKSHFDVKPLHFARAIRNCMGYTPKKYRQILSQLRSHLNVLENLMATRQFDKIVFSQVPAIAMKKTYKAFQRDTNADGVKSDERQKLSENYKEYLRDLAKGGVTKVNVTGIQPHELVNTYLNNPLCELDPLVEAQWGALRSRISQHGTFSRSTAIVDVSSSMSGRPMEVAIALGILLSELTDEPYKNKVLTFHSDPTWHTITGDTLKEKVACLKNANWGGSTNLSKSLKLILDEAVSNSGSKIADTLYIFTDMQFDCVDSGTTEWLSTFEHSERMFREAGFEFPKIICWNLRTSSTKTLPICSDQPGYAMLSGFSAELLKQVLNKEDITPYSIMMQTLQNYSVPDIVNTELSKIISFDWTDHLETLNSLISECQIVSSHKRAVKTTEELTQDDWKTSPTEEELEQSLILVDGW